MVAICKIASEGKLPDLATEDDWMRYIHKTMKNRILLAKERLQTDRRGGDYQQVAVDLDLRPAPQAPDGPMAGPSDRLDHLIDGIKDRSLREIVLGFFAGQTHKEIADRLGVSERTVRRKRKRLADLLARLTRLTEF